MVELLELLSAAKALESWLVEPRALPAFEDNACRFNPVVQLMTDHHPSIATPLSYSLRIRFAPLPTTTALPSASKMACIVCWYQ